LATCFNNVVVQTPHYHANLSIRFEQKKPKNSFSLCNRFSKREKLSKIENILKKTFEKVCKSKNSFYLCNRFSKREKLSKIENILKKLLKKFANQKIIFTFALAFLNERS